ncbi:putative type I restriction-modification methylase S subunit [Ralstonia solanacearum CMR15]|nr:putative type I restriction-modification methylase S subunit [Ralstonia solanacearum CMR15]
MSHYKPYPAYKDSGVRWLGKVPAHWSVGRLANSFEERRAKVSDKDFPALSVTKLGVVPQLENVAKTDDGDNRRMVLKGDIAINSRSDRKGASGLADRDGSVSLIITVLTPKPSVWGEYCHHLIRSEIFQEEYFRVGNGLVADLWTTNYSSMRTIFLARPPIEEQKAIASHLDRETARIDALVEKKTRFIELLGEKRQALITHAVTKGLGPGKPMKGSGVEWLGEVPEHWVIKRLKFIARVQTGVAKGKDLADKDTIEVPYLRVANVQDGFLDLDEVATIEIDKRDLERYLLQLGDVLMNEGGDFDKLGRGHVWSGEISPCIHQNHVFAVRPHGVSSPWLNAFTSSAAAQFYFMGKSKQSTNLASISSSNLMELPVPVPPEPEQFEILAEVQKNLEKLDNVVRKTERSIELLREHRSALITAAVTGQIDLRDTVAAASQIDLRKTA